MVGRRPPRLRVQELRAPCVPVCVRVCPRASACSARACARTASQLAAVQSSQQAPADPRHRRRTVRATTRSAVARRCRFRLSPSTKRPQPSSRRRPRSPFESPPYSSVVMANRVQDYGIDVALHRKMNSRYDSTLEGEIVSWIHALTNEQVPRGREQFQRAMKSGQILVKLINAVFTGTPSRQDIAQHVGIPLRINMKPQQFNHMENIENFLKAAEAYGVPRPSLFQTVDLYESRNLPQVLSCIQQLGTECQRNGFNGPVIGPRPTTSTRRNFSVEKLRAGHGIIGLQSGTNQFASQKGMSLGAVRHIADIRCDDFNPEGQAVIGLQMGTNKFASQKGMNIGGVRHIADIRCDDVNPEGQSVIGLQMGTNQVASQKGMSFGGVRHVADIRCDNVTKEGACVIGLQMGTNQLASQKGMSFGGVRHVADIRCDDLLREAQAIPNLQMGPRPDDVASQKGMSFGAQRHITDIH